MAVNTNRQGANFELEVMHYLCGCACETSHRAPKHVGWRGFGYDGIRSSGSAGAADIILVPPARPGVTYYGPLLFIQCKINQKRASLSPAERRAVVDLADRGCGRAVTAFRAKDETTGRVRPHFRLLIGTGPRDWVPWEPGASPE
jgi:hypothetical protein